VARRRRRVPHPAHGFINVRAFRHAIAGHPGATPTRTSRARSRTSRRSAPRSRPRWVSATLPASRSPSASGGPGATFWMIVAGFLGMTTKFTECTLARCTATWTGRARAGRSDAVPVERAGGTRACRVRTILAVIFAVLCIGGSLGGGNSFQVNQSMNALQETVPFLADNAPWALRPAHDRARRHRDHRRHPPDRTVADKIVPLMAVVYVGAACCDPCQRSPQRARRARRDLPPGIQPGRGLRRLHRRARRRVPARGLLQRGRRRLRGHRALRRAKTEYPVREGIVALLEPFIDTVVICTMTALVIVFSGAYNNPAYADRSSPATRAPRSRRARSARRWPLPVRAVLRRLPVRVLDHDLVVVLRRALRGLAVRRRARHCPTRLLFLVFVFLGSVMTRRTC
jgi:alanine or glycine:cation symporter, AGCS family